MRGTRARLATQKLVVGLFFFLEGECTFAQAPPAPVAPPAQTAAAQLPFEENLHLSSPPAPISLDAGTGRWYVFASYGQASAPRSQGFAEAATLSFARESPLGAGFSWGLELTPLFVVNQTRVDLPGRPRETVFAVAALPLLVFDAFPRSAVGVRLEGGVGLFWGFSPVPAEGSRFNFFDLFGGQVRVRLSGRAALFCGLRRTHVSNLGIVGSDNPGLSFYSGAVGLSWPAH